MCHECRREGVRARESHAPSVHQPVCLPLLARVLAVVVPRLHALPELGPARLSYHPVTREVPVLGTRRVGAECVEVDEEDIRHDSQRRSPRRQLIVPRYAVLPVAHEAFVVLVDTHARHYRVWFAAEPVARLVGRFCGQERGRLVAHVARLVGCRCEADDVARSTELDEVALGHRGGSLNAWLCADLRAQVRYVAMRAANRGHKCKEERARKLGCIEEGVTTGQARAPAQRRRRRARLPRRRLRRVRYEVDICGEDIVSLASGEGRIAQQVVREAVGGRAIPDVLRVQASKELRPRSRKGIAPGLRAHTFTNESATRSGAGTGCPS
eukprot:scaffold84703_cov28-Tisochrysis_lutea.AAC.2